MLSLIAFLHYRVLNWLKRIWYVEIIQFFKQEIRYLIKLLNNVIQYAKMNKNAFGFNLIQHMVNAKVEKKVVN